MNNANFQLSFSFLVMILEVLISETQQHLKRLLAQILINLSLSQWYLIEVLVFVKFDDRYFHLLKAFTFLACLPISDCIPVLNPNTRFIYNLYIHVELKH